VQILQEQFAAHRILSSLDFPLAGADAASLPPGAGAVASEWKVRALGLALALLRDGHFEWEDFRQALLEQLGRVENASPESWHYCRQWARALERVIGAAGLVDAGTLAELQSLAQRADHEAVSLPPA
jgi:nitrile hydratase accessory protein